MPILDIINAHAVPFLLVAFRLAGLAVFTPVLAITGMPRPFRILLALMLAAAVYPGLPTHLQLQPDLTLVELLPLVAGELAIGAVIGFIAAIPIASLDLAGLVMGNQVGLGLARVYNPDTDTDSEAIGQLMTYLGVSAFVAMGGLDALYLSVVRSFDRVPMGGLAPSQVPLDLITGTIASGFELALRVAMPVIGVILLVLAAMGALMKTMPQFNVLTVGFAIKILIALFVIAAAASAIHNAAADEIEHTLTTIARWVDAQGAPR